MLRSPLRLVMTTRLLVLFSEPGALFGQRNNSGNSAAIVVSPAASVKRIVNVFILEKWVVGFFLFHCSERAMSRTEQSRARQRKDLFAHFLLEEICALEAAAH